MAGKLYIKTFGCQMNEYDSAKMADVLARSHGLEPAQAPEEADVLLLNTCSIREKAQEKVFSQLGKWKAWKQDNPNLVIGVGGCVASQEGEALRDDENYCHTAVWEYAGSDSEPSFHKEPLAFENVELTQRSYK